MHLLVTDVLTCPGCGPDFGLILLADVLENRRVLEGSLGCPNCRRTYPIRAGVARLYAEPAAARQDEATAPKAAPRGTGGEGTTPPTDPAAAAVRLAALLGLEQGRGMVLLAGQLPGRDRALAEVIDGLEVISLEPHGAPAEGREGEGVSRVAAAPASLPFASRSLRGVALAGAVPDAVLREAVRVVAPTGRLVIEGAAPGAAGRLATLGLSPLVDQEGVVVAVMKGPV
jgi:uncharacterized protein YbaR (Trm112 family)